jgi:PTS system mannitol-specific IIC component
MRKLGQLLSAMIYQNIVVIIAVGIIREIFGIYGWFYNDRILLLVNPIYNTLLPVLIGATGGRLLGGSRGAVVASVAVFGLTLSSSTPAILGAMIIGPLAGWMVNKFDQLVKKKLPGVGYELLIGNVIAVIIAVVLTSVCFLYVGQTLSAGMRWSIGISENIIYSGWLPLVSVMIEPAKVFFFNNIINHGVLGPLGIQQAKELGKSIFFLLEANPGPGLGVLLAYWLKTKIEQKKGAKMAALILSFGGIHEVYFPFILLRPILIISLILGGMVGIFTFQMFDVGLVSIPSPGSIFMLIGLAPREDMLFILIGVILSTVTSFLCSMLILKPISSSPTEQDNRANIAEFFHDFGNNSDGMNERSLMQKKQTNAYEMGTFNKIENIVFVCEAGMGSSAMGAAVLKKKLKQANLTITVGNASLSEISQDADLIVCHQKMLPYARIAAPDKICYPLQSFTDMKGYDELVERLKH